MTKTITDILPDALPLPQDSALPALRPQWAQQPINALWSRFLSVAKEICPCYNLPSSHAQIVYDIFRWCICSQDGPYDSSKGLWLCGNIGTGKSTLLAIVREFCRLCRKPDADGWPYGFRCISAPLLCSQYQAYGIEAITPYCESSRLAIDDLGAELIPVSHYGDPLNVLQYILQVRYDRRRDSFTHVTTNLTLDQVAEIYGERVLDRCKEMFNVVTLLGKSHRDDLTRREAAQ